MLDEAEKSLGETHGPPTVAAMIDAFRPTDYRVGNWFNIAIDRWERLLGPKQGTLLL